MLTDMSGRQQHLVVGKSLENYPTTSVDPTELQVKLGKEISGALERVNAERSNQVVLETKVWNTRQDHAGNIDEN